MNNQPSFLKFLIMVVVNIIMLLPFYLLSEELATRPPIELIIMLPMCAIIILITNVGLSDYLNRKLNNRK